MRPVPTLVHVSASNTVPCIPRFAGARKAAVGVGAGGVRGASGRAKHAFVHVGARLVARQIEGLVAAADVHVARGRGATLGYALGPRLSRQARC